MNNNEAIKKALSELPLETQRAIKDFDWNLKSSELSNKFRLNLNEISILKEETMSVLVGLSRAKDYRERLRKKMKVSEDMANNLVMYANDNIFFELHEQVFGSESKESIEEEVLKNLRKEGIDLLEPRYKTLSENTNNIAKKSKEVYQESIEKDDLVGITTHRLDTNILSSKKQQVPERVLENNPTYKDDKNDSNKQDLDRYTYENLSISTNEQIDIN